jgi:hypothetical protein
MSSVTHTFNPASHVQPDMKMIGAAIGVVLLIFAIAENSTTSGVNTEAKTGSNKFETGIWLRRQTDGASGYDDKSYPQCE